MNKQKTRKKVVAFLLSMLMLISLFQNISYTPIAEGGETEATVETAAEGGETEATVESLPDASETDAVSAQVQVLSEATQVVNDGESKDLLADAGVKLVGLELTGKYKDSNGADQLLKFDMNDEISIPGDAGIYMDLKFSLPDGNQVTKDTDYVYKLPDTVRVDVDESHELVNETGQSIGNVHIRKDGTLTFNFYEAKVKGNSNISFYVKFEGKFSSDLAEGNKKGQLVFPTGDGNYTFKVNVEEPTNSEPEKTHRDYTLSKYGTVTTKEINGKQKKVIHWSLDLWPDERKNFSGTIEDPLPEGLTYVTDSMKVSGQKNENAGTITDKSTNDTVRFEIKDYNVYHTLKIEFDTILEDTFNEIIKNDTQITKDNTASFNPDDTKDKTATSNKATVTVKPDVLTKTGVNNAGVITWTVEINADQFDLKNTTYTDTIGDGQTLTGAITIDPSGPNVTVSTDPTNNQFTINFGSSENKTKYKITYTTQQTDWAKDKFENNGKLTGGSFDYSVSASVPGANIIRKTNMQYDSVMHTITWQIVVNQDKLNLGNTTVTDVIPKYKHWDNNEYAALELASVTLDDGTKLNLEDTNIKTSDGFKYTFPENEINGKTRTLTVVTKLTNEIINKFDNQGINISNKAQLTTATITTPAESTATQHTDIKKTDLIRKTGTIRSDGLIQWDIYVNASTLKKEMIEITDTIGNNQSYVEGSARIAKDNWRFDNTYEIEQGNVYACTPEVNGNILTFTFDATHAFPVDNFNQVGFYIRYYTKANLDDLKKTEESTLYENEATAKIDFEGNISLADTKKASVTGKVGGVIDKQAQYIKGQRTVEWSVYINKPGYDLSEAVNPRIEDVLSSYYDYRYGKLYLVGADGTETEVNASDYVVTCVNHLLTVQLPKDTDNKYPSTNTYVFRFQTEFNCYPEQLSKDGISNSVSFIGLSETYTKTSETIKDIQFSSSSAGASTRHAIKLRKVDSDTKVPLKNAVFDMYVGEVKVASAQTDSDGYALFEDLVISEGAEIDIKEITAPDGYKLPDEAKRVTKVAMSKFNDIPADSQGVRTMEIQIENQADTQTNTGKIELTKVDEDDNNVKLSGAEFTLYNATDYPITATSSGMTRLTDADGKVEFGSLAIGTDASTPKVYYVVETKTPEGYLFDASNRIAVKASIDASGNTTYEQGTINASGNFVKNSISTSTIENKKTTATLQITKVEADTDSANPLENAKFGLYKDAQCTNPVGTATTNAAGKAIFTGLELGRTYYYREEKAPDGYVLDSSVREVMIGAGTETEVVPKEVTVEDVKQNGSIRVKKVDDSIPANPIEGIKFKLKNSNGDYVQENGSSEEYVVKTDKDGEAVFENLPYGKYTLEEILGSVSGKYEAATSIPEITIDSNSTKDVTVVNKIKKFKLQVVKKDADISAGTKYLPGAKFTLYSSGGAKLYEKVTDANGSIEFDDLAYDEYYITEMEAPEGYNKVSGRITFNAADFETTSTPSGTGWSAEWNAATKTFVITVQDTKQNGKIVLTKTGKDGTTALKGAEFTLYKDGLKVTTVTSDTNGKVAFTGLAYGTYTVQETKAPTGTVKTYIMDPTVYTVEVISDDKSQIVSPTVGNVVDSGTSLVTVTNDEQLTSPPNISFKLLKQAKDGVTSRETPLDGATFGFYEITTGRTEKLLATAISGYDGMVYFRRVNIQNCDDDSTFVVRELQAPIGYKKSEEEYVLGSKKTDLNAYADVPSGENTGKMDAEIFWILTKNAVSTAPIEATVVNEQILGSVYVQKTSSYDNTALAGAEFTLYEENGTTRVNGSGIINPQTTDENGGVTFKNLPLGKYVVKETKAPKGYVVSTETQTVTINNDTLQSCTFRDNRIDLSVSKLAVGGSAEIPGAKLAITKTNGTTVVEWTSSTTPKKISYAELETGVTYILKETSAPAGYAYSANIRFEIKADGTISITNPAANASVSGQTLVMRDAPIAISVAKVDVANAPLSNAILAVIDKTSGKELERFTTNGTAHALDMSKITVPAAENTKRDYILREISAPTGYEIAEDIIFAVDRAGTVYTKNTAGNYIPVSAVGTTATLTMMDKKKPEGTIYIRKLTPAGNTLSGASLAIYKKNDYDGNQASATPEVSEFTSGTTPHAIKVTPSEPNTLHPNVEYVLVEKSAPDGYIIAKPITFTIKDVGTTSGTTQYRITTISDTNSLNSDKVTIMMTDQPLSLRIKKETSAGDLLEGAILKLYEGTTADETKCIETISTKRTNMHTVEFTKLEAGKEYLLVETDAPNGFLKSGNIKFKIGADGTITKQYLEQKDGTWKDSNVFGNIIIMTDDEKAVTLSKIDSGTNGNLAGATVKLESVVYGTYDVNGYDRNFTTQTFTTTSDVISLDANLFHTGCVYQLSEITAPTGYGYAKDVVFLYTDDHRVQYLTSSNKGLDRTVYMFDKPIKLSIHKKNSVTNGYVKDAKLQILDDAGIVVTSWTTGTDAKAVGGKLTAPVTGRKKYTLQEVEAPKGYTKAKDICFEVASDGTIYIADANGDYTQAVTEITMHDEPQLQIIKQNPDGEAVAGATLTITKKDDAAFTPITWVSTDEPKVFDNSQFAPDETYILTETKAPDGYGYAKSVSFTIGADGTVKADGKVVANHTIGMTDTPIEVVFEKQDADSKRTIAGAQIAIQNAAGDVIYTFTTTESAVAIPKEVLQAPAKEGVLANYTFVELSAPFGYEKAEPVAFAIDSEGNVYAKNPENGEMTLLSSLGIKALIMYDAPDYLHISKVDATNSEEIDGAKLAIRDADGNEIVSWESSKKDGAKKLSISEYFEADKEYTLNEVEAPKGYELAEAIVFKIGTDNVIYVKDASGAFTAVTDRTIVMKDLPSTSVVTTETTTTTTTTSSNTSKKTGDTAPVAPITVVMLVAAVGIIILGVVKKKRNDK